ncbi:MAG TPA: hypothetical protein PLL75_03575 [Candidatus Omnitrophota bacterium]|nr:hypothetical protein [Candidatus Omnitrophota bacterium]
MPGLVIVKRKGSDRANACNVGSEIAGKLYGRDWLKVSEIVTENGFFVGLVLGAKDHSGVLETNAGLMAWFGRPFYNGTLLTPHLPEGLREQLDQGDLKGILNAITGCFQLVIYFRSKDECFVVSDKISTHPSYYTETKDFIAISPEVLSFKTLKKHGWKPTVRRDAMFEFMSSGYLWGDGTFWDEVRRLGPGQLIRMEKTEVAIESYWRARFEGAKQTERALIDELFDAVQQDSALLPEGKAVLTLSGGYDSRALLGLLKLSGKQFETISYTFGTSVYKGADADVGGYYAKKAGVPHRFYQSRIDAPERVIEDIKRAVRSSGGDNHLVSMQDAFLGEGFYQELAGSYDFMIRGDEVWGWGDYAANPQMAFRECILFNLNELVYPQRLLKPDTFGHGVQYLEDLRGRLTAEYGAQDIPANDLKDCLYWRHREARLLQGMAYFRRCYLPHQAPFLFDRTLAVIQKIPGELRIKKRLFMRMCETKFPELFCDKTAILPYSSDTNNFSVLYSNERFKEFIRGNLLEGPEIFRNAFDSCALEGWIKTVLAGSGSDERKLKVKYDITGALNRFLTPIMKGHLKALLVRWRAPKFPVLGVNYLFRLLALSLALAEYEEN